MGPLVRGLLVCFTLVRLYWVWHSAVRVYELLWENLVGPAMLWGVALMLSIASLLVIKRGLERE